MAKWATIAGAALLVVLWASRARASQAAPAGFVGDWTYMDGTQAGAGVVM